jgi:DNA repair exonuclease SbcCD ATPase subunit
MILFKKLRWKNFLSTGNVFTEIDLNKSSTTLIVGENGAGKSTILDALTYALFGKPFRKINKPQLINSINRKDSVVEIEFQINQNSYTIVRGMKPNVFEVYQNGMLVNQSAEMRDYQEYLEKHILKLNFKSFCQVVVLGSATFQPFMQLPGGQRREIIEDLLDLQIFTTMNSILKDRILRNNEEVSEVTSEQKLVMEKIKIYQDHMLEKQSNNEKLIANKIEQIEETSFKISELDVKYWNYDKDINELKEVVWDEESISKKITKLSQLKHKIEAKRALIENDVKFFEEHEGCPTCKQNIDESFKKQTIESKRDQISEIEGGLKELVAEYDAANNRLKEIMNIHSTINSFSMEQFKFKNQIDSLIKYRDQLEKEIKNINDSQEADESHKIGELEKELENIANRYEVVMSQKQIYSVASVLLRDGGIKARIIKQYVPVINKLINKYLSSMDFFVQFELDEEFNETIKSRFRDEFSYASFSEGEKMRINLAILFTWRAVAKLRNSVSTNLLIMDEVMDSSLDSNGTEEFLKILQQLTQDTNTFIISHKTDQLYDKFASVLKFEKKQNFSKLAA